MRDSEGNPVRSAEGGCIDSTVGRAGNMTEGCVKTPKPSTYRILQNLIPFPNVSYDSPPPLPAAEIVRFVPSNTFAGGQASVTLELRDELYGFLASLEGYQRIERFEVVGFGDGNPNQSYAQWLGDKRAESVRNFLVARGIASTMISSHGTAEGGDGRRQRVEVLVTVRGRR